jgi:uncharacterized repeat protein (TIGR04138 family)
MQELAQAIAQLVREDRRYSFEAYAFLFEALQYAQNVLEMGAESPGEPAEQGQEASPQRHVTGQELCEAIRHFALDQYGYMAKTVLNNWGIHGTGDFGEMVYNLIRIGHMQRRPPTLATISTTSTISTRPSGRSSRSRGRSKNRSPLPQGETDRSLSRRAKNQSPLPPGEQMVPSPAGRGLG